MRLKKSLMISAIAAVGLLGLTACSDSGAPTAEETAPTETVEFEAGTTMARLNEAGAITIGTKFDQPLFGLKNPTTNEVEGFDAEIGLLAVAALR
jgi:glutamate transport system substrate-binding protein